LFAPARLPDDASTRILAAVRAILKDWPTDMHDTLEDLLVARTYAELEPGESARLVRTLTTDDIALVATSSGDVNPAHLDAEFAANEVFHGVVGHGVWTAGLVSAVLGTKLPGPGTIYVSQDLRFRRPVAPGDTITAEVTVSEKKPDRRVVLACRCTNQAGEVVALGTAEVIAPEIARAVPRGKPPAVAVQRHDRLAALVERARAGAPLPVAIAHPCDEASLGGALAAMRAGLIAPVLVGPEAKVRAVADAIGADISELPLEVVPHSHAAAERAAALARDGVVKAVMKGSLHTDELMRAVLSKEAALRTDRRLSHAYVIDVPAYHKILIVTDAAVNIAPSLAEKRDICQNAVDLARVLGTLEPKVAVLSAVETIDPAIASTLDAAALTLMARRGQIRGGLVDGPLAFDNAIDREAAAVKGIASPVAGDADILLVPDLESGNMLAKQLLYFAGAEGAGLVLGARVPVVLTSRADSEAVRVASSALAKLVVAAREIG
jgi:phosphate acetyltransferase